MRTKFRKLMTIAAVLLSVALVGSACGSGGSDSGQEAKKITIGYIAWDENIALSNLYANVLKDKGYQVDLRQLDAGPIYAGMAKGDVDVFLDAWLPTTHADYWKQYQDKLEDLGNWYDNATLNIAVPKYVDGVNSLADLKANASKFDGKITGIEPSAGEMRIAKDEMMPAYGLDGAMQLQQSSTPAMLASLTKAINDKKPIAVTLWHPHWAYSRFELKDLADPKGAMGKGEKLHIIGRKGFAKDFPALAEVSKSFKMDDKQLGSLEDAIQKAGKGQESQAAKQWAENNKSFVDSAFAKL